MLKLRHLYLIYIISLCCINSVVIVRGEEYIVTKLSLLESKIDCLVTMLSRVAPDISTDIPELPDDVDLPINSMANLITIEENLNGDDRSLKNSMVNYLFQISF